MLGSLRRPAIFMALGLIIGFIGFGINAYAEPASLQLFRVAARLEDQPDFTLAGTIASQLSNPAVTTACTRNTSCGIAGLIATAEASDNDNDMLERLAAGEIDAAIIRGDHLAHVLAAHHGTLQDKLAIVATLGFTEGEAIASMKLHRRVYKTNLLSETVAKDEPVRNEIQEYSTQKTGELPVQLLVRADASVSLIYQITRILCEAHRPSLSAKSNERFHPSNYDRASQIALIPLHTGAIQYYDEIGVLPHKIAAK